MSARPSIVVLGCGMGGLVASSLLSKQVRNAATVTVIEQRTTLPFPPAYHGLIFGWRQPKQVQRHLSTIAKTKNLRIVNERAEKVDVKRRVVNTRSRELPYDRLIVSLGAELAPGEVQGLEEYSHNAYELEGALKLRDTLHNFRGGTILIGICRLPIKCPPAPYGLSLLLEDHFRRSKRKVDIHFFTPETQPVPAAGAVVGKQVERLLTSRGVKYHPKARLVKVERDRGVFENGSEISYDILIAVPPHRCPKIVVEGGLTDSSGWVPVNPHSLATKFEDVYAIGDVASIETPHGHVPFLPKAGVFAQGQAEVVANNIAVSITRKGESRYWDGNGECFLEVNKGESAFLRGTFLSNPPRLEFHPPRRKWHLEKLKLEKRWMSY